MKVSNKKTTLLFIISMLFVMSSTLFADTYRATVFEVEVVNQNYNNKSEKYSQKLSCTEEIKTKGNYYGTDTKTITSPDHLTKLQNGTLQLKFSRLPDDNRNAIGGRCVTEGSTTIFGDGELSARIFIHSNVLSSDAVFTVGILPNETFDKEKELDLFVINLLDNNGRPVMKFGNPGRSVDVDLAKIIKKREWINVIMKRKGDLCKLDLQNDSGTKFFSYENLPCHFGDKKEIVNGVENLNRIVINSRSRDFQNTESSFISISNVKWVRNKVNK